MCGKNGALKVITTNKKTKNRNKALILGIETFRDHEDSEPYKKMCLNQRNAK